MHEVIGDKRIIIYVPKDAKTKIAENKILTSGEMASFMSWMRDNTCRLVASDKKLVDEVSFTTMTQSEMTDVLNSCLKILDAVEGFQRGKLQEKRTKLLARMEKASDKLSREYDRLSGLGKQDDNEGGHAGQLSLVKGLLNFNQYLVRQYASPVTELVTHAGGQVDFAIAFVRRNMAQYKKRD